MQVGLFPTRVRKFVRLTPKQAYEGLLYLMRTDLGAKGIKSGKHGDRELMLIRTRLGLAIGVTVNIRIIPEDGASTMEFNFSYRRSLYLIFALLIAIVSMSIIFRTFIPLIGALFIFPLAYIVNSKVKKFIGTVGEVMPHLEQEYERRALTEDRRRWQAESKDAEELYKRLCEKYSKTWGSTHILEYKIAEYEKKGLTREEAIRKTAEEEGIF